MKNGKVPDIRPDEKKYIKEMHTTTTVPDMARELGRGAATVYAWMKDMGLQVYKAPRKHWHGGHPFRVQNRRMEKQILLNNIVNNGKPYQP